MTDGPAGQPTALTAVRQGRLVRNITWLAAASLISKLWTLATLFLLGRYLGEALFGRLAIALAIPAALEGLADLGIGWALVREGASRPDRLRELAASAIVPKFLLGAVLVLVSITVARTLGFPDEIVEATAYLAIARALDSLTYLWRAVFQSIERMDYEAASFAFDGVTRFLLIAFGLLEGFGVLGFAKALAVAALISSAGTAAFAAHRVLKGMRPRLMPPLGLLVAGLPLAAVWLLDSLSLRVGTIAVGALRGDASAGELAAGLRIVEPALSIPAILAIAILPLATRHLAEGHATLEWLAGSSFRLVALLGIASAIALGGLAPVLVPAVFGGEFDRAVEVVRILALGVVPLFVRGLLLAFMVTLRLQARLVASLLGGAAVQVVLCVALAAWLGPLAGAVALVAGETATVTLAIAISPNLRSLGIARSAAVAGALPFTLWAFLLIPFVGDVAATVIALGCLLIAVRRFRLVEDRDIRYFERAVPVVGRSARWLLS